MRIFNNYDPTQTGIPTPIPSHNNTSNPLSLAQQISMWSVIAALGSLIVLVGGFYVGRRCHKLCKPFDENQVIKQRSHSIVSNSSYDSEPEYAQLSELKEYILQP